MKIQQTFTVGQPLPVVWSFFHDIPKLAACLPGAEYLGRKDDGRLAGKVSSKIGPFQANFEGEAQVAYDEDAKSVDFEGKGVDKKGASRGRMTMACRLAGEGNATRVAVDADVQLSGSIAQFGRTGLLTEIANRLVADFVTNAEAELARAAPSVATPAGPGTASPEGEVQAAPPADAPARATSAGKPLNASALLWAVIKSWFRSLFGGSPKERSDTR